MAVPSTNLSEDTLPNTNLSEDTALPSTPTERRRSRASTSPNFKKGQAFADLLGQRELTGETEYLPHCVYDVSRTEQRVLIINTGGTFCCQQTGEGPLAPCHDALTNIIGSLGYSESGDCFVQKTDYGVYTPAGQVEIQPLQPLLDSTNATPQNWLAIADRVLAAQPKPEMIGEKRLLTGPYIGVIVVHGTDTLAFTASALSFFLKDIGVPVIVLGSQLPGNVPNSDAMTNLADALIFLRRNWEFACRKSHEHMNVITPADRRLFLGTCVDKFSASSTTAFASHNWPSVVEHTSFSLTRHARRKAIDNFMQIAASLEKQDFCPNLTVTRGPNGELRVPVIIKLTPTLNYNSVSFAAWIAEGLEAQGEQKAGILIEGYGSGNVSEPAVAAISGALIKHRTNHHPVKVCLAVVTQCPAGSAGGSYAVGLENALRSASIDLKFNTEAFLLEDMTKPAAITKMVWILNNGSLGWDALAKFQHGEARSKHF